MQLSQTARVAIIGVAGAAAAFFVFGGGSLLFGGGSSGDPNDAVPKESFLVASIDAQELRKSPVYAVVAGKDGSGAATRALGVGAIADACGFDPLTRVTRMAVAVPEEGDRGDIGLAARVDVTRNELEKCTKALAEKRGGKAEPKEVGSFAVIEGPSGAKLAYGPGGLLVAGKGKWLDTMLGAAQKTKPGLSASHEHMALRDALTAREGWRTPTILVTALLPKSYRDEKRREWGAELDAADPSNQVMGGVLGVASVGAAIKAGGPGGNVEVEVELTCDSPDACAVVEKLIQRKRLDWSKDFMLRLAGFGPAIDSLDVKRDGAHLRATASSNADSLASAIERALKHGRETPRPTPRPEPEPQPDETVRADAGPGKKDAGSQARP